MVFALLIHKYRKKPSFLGVFASDGGKLSIKTTVEKKAKKHLFTFFGYTHINKTIIDGFF